MEPFISSDLASKISFLIFWLNGCNLFFVVCMLYYLNKVFGHVSYFYDRYDSMKWESHKELCNRKTIILLKICLRYSDKMTSIWTAYIRISIYSVIVFVIIFFLVILPVHVLSPQTVDCSPENIEYFAAVLSFIFTIWFYLGVCAIVSLIVVEFFREGNCEWVFKRGNEYDRIYSGDKPEGMMTGDYVISYLESKIS